MLKRILLMTTGWMSISLLAAAMAVSVVSDPADAARLRERASRVAARHPHLRIVAPKPLKHEPAPTIAATVPAPHVINTPTVGASVSAAAPVNQLTCIAGC